MGEARWGRPSGGGQVGEARWVSQVGGEALILTPPTTPALLCTPVTNTRQPSLCMSGRADVSQPCACCRALSPPPPPPLTLRMPRPSAPPPLGTTDKLSAHLINEITMTRLN